MHNSQVAHCRDAESMKTEVVDRPLYHAVQESGVDIRSTEQTGVKQKKALKSGSQPSRSIHHEQFHRQTCILLATLQH